MTSSNDFWGSPGRAGGEKPKEKTRVRVVRLFNTKVHREEMRVAATHQMVDMVRLNPLLGCALRPKPQARPMRVHRIYACRNWVHHRVLRRRSPIPAHRNRAKWTLATARSGLSRLGSQPVHSHRKGAVMPHMMPGQQARAFDASSFPTTSTRSPPVAPCQRGEARPG